MKKLVIVLLFLSQWVFSQTEKGSFIFSGNTSAAFSKTKTKSNFSESDITSFDVNPTFGYFVKDHFFVGLTGTFEFTHTNYDQNYIDKNTLTVLMPTVGYYFPVEGSLNPLLLQVLAMRISNRSLKQPQILFSQIQLLKESKPIDITVLLVHLLAVVVILSLRTFL